MIGCTACAVAAEPHELAFAFAFALALALAIGAGAGATGLLPHELGAGAAFGRLPAAIDGIGVLGTGWLNVAGIDAIARGLTNGMTFADTPLAGADAGAGRPDTERDPVGGGATRRNPVGTSASMTVRSSFSNGRGTCGIARSCVASSRTAIRGRDFRGCIWNREPSAIDSPSVLLRSSLIAYACAQFALGSSGSDWAGRSSPMLRSARGNCTERHARVVRVRRHRSC